MKKILIVSIIVVTAFFSSVVYAQNIHSEEQVDIVVTLNGTPLQFDVSPQLVNNRTMLPMRAIFEALGAEVTWLEEDRIIFATKGNSMIVMKIGDSNMSVQRAGEDGNTIVTLDAPPYIENNRTLVPVRAIAEVMDAKVDWISETRTVVIITEQEAVN